MSFYSRDNWLFFHPYSAGRRVTTAGFEWKGLGGSRLSNCPLSHSRTALASHHGFRMSTWDSNTSDRIRLYRHRASRGEARQRTTNTGYHMKIQVLKHDGLCHVGDLDMLKHNHPLLTVTYSNSPSDLEGTIRDLLKSGVDKSCIINFVHLRTDCLLRRLKLALM
jgi:hypothetical protein